MKVEEQLLLAAYLCSIVAPEGKCQKCSIPRSSGFKVLSKSCLLKSFMKDFIPCMFSSIGQKGRVLMEDTARVEKTAKFCLRLKTRDEK